MSVLAAHGDADAGRARSRPGEIADVDLLVLEGYGMERLVRERGRAARRSMSRRAAAPVPRPSSARQAERRQIRQAGDVIEVKCVRTMSSRATPSSSSGRSTSRPTPVPASIMIAASPSRSSAQAVWRPCAGNHPPPPRIVSIACDTMSLRRTRTVRRVARLRADVARGERQPEQKPCSCSRSSASSGQQVLLGAACQLPSPVSVCRPLVVTCSACARRSLGCRRRSTSPFASSSSIVETIELGSIPDAFAEGVLGHRPLRVEHVQRSPHPRLSGRAIPAAPRTASGPPSPSG